MNDDSGTHSYDEFVRPASIGNEVRLYVMSESEIFPVGIRPLCHQDKGARREERWREHILGIADTTESSELMKEHR